MQSEEAQVQEVGGHAAEDQKQIRIPAQSNEILQS